jgi:MFS family permease
MTASTPTVDESAKLAADAAIADILRDIARGGITGLIVGLVGIGIGGRIVMRLAALLVPESVGAFTENGNRIGSITLGGSVGLVILGLFLGATVATIWVVISPWIPGVRLRRAILAMPIAVGLGASGLIEGQNPDFFVLDHHPAVVGLLLLLVAVIGLLFALVDEALDRRLPPATGRALTAYWVLTIIGLTVAMLVVLSILSNPKTGLMGVALVAAGLSTLGAWSLRIKGSDRPTWLVVVGRSALVVAIVAGYASAVPEITRALGIA